MNMLVTVQSATNGARIVSVVLALAILIWWMPSVVRIVRGEHADGDAHRAGWVPLAAAVLTFEVRWFWPNLDLATKDRLALFAHCGMAMALMFAIYVHGHRVGTIKLRRAFLIHAAMLVASIGASSLLR